jgi:hypothetical protein
MNENILFCLLVFGFLILPPAATVLAQGPLAQDKKPAVI